MCLRLHEKEALAKLEDYGYSISRAEYYRLWNEVKESALKSIGVTTYLIRYLAWKISSSSQLDHRSIFIISGTREVFANFIKEKMASLFKRNFPMMNLYTKYIEMVLKNTWIKVFLTTATKDIRGYFEAAYIWADEASFFPDSVQDELISVRKPYQTKSNCKIILSSTPNKPNVLMNRLKGTPRYFKLRLPYDYGLGKIYSKEDIDKAKQSVSFEREFNLKYLGKQGNLFTDLQVKQCEALGQQYDTLKIPVSQFTLKSVGCDFGWSSSETGIVVLEHIQHEAKHIIRVIDCHLIEKGDPNAVVNLCWDIYKRHNFMNTAYFVDGSDRSMVKLLKIRWQESLYWDNVKDFGHNSNIKIRPVNFSSEHKNMLGHLHSIASKGYLAIDPKYKELVTSLRTAFAQELSLDKKQTSYDDLLDALRLSLKAFEFK
jgi:hypothetical protein